MSVAQDQVVSFHYELKNESGDLLESSRNGEPMAYLHGAGNIIPGLEKAMLGKGAGERFSATVAPEEAYGHRNDALVQRLPIKYLRAPGKLKAGGVALIQTREGMRQVQVIKVGRFHADVDANHPLAGQALTFDVEIVDIRAASAEEIAHGHAHGPGGHHHEEE